MRFNGEWIQCEDGIVRPVIRAEILTGESRWRAFELLVDTGADRTVISADVLESLSVETTVPQDRIGGIGGVVDSVSVNTQIRLSRDDGQKALFRGQYAACTVHEALDMSVLGRDILEMFALIVDRQGDVVHDRRPAFLHDRISNGLSLSRITSAVTGRQREIVHTDSA